MESPHETVDSQGPFISDEVRQVLEIIFYCTVGGLIGVVGSAVNIINIIVFAAQGFSDSVSISLCALAVSDLGFLLMMVGTSVYTNPMFRYSNINFDIAEIQYITGSVFLSCFVRITHLITAFITVERCVCIALPLKVKDIITPKRTLISMAVIYVIIFAVNLPNISSVYQAPAFNPELNKTVVGARDTRYTFQNVSHTFSVFVQISSFTTVIICTVILILKLMTKSKWRQKSISTSNALDSTSTRDKRVMKMVTFISITFIVLYFPSVINLIVIVCLSPERSLSGSFWNLYYTIAGIISAIDGINSSVSILIYYNMSSKFRATFKEVFCKATTSSSK